MTFKEEIELQLRDNKMVSYEILSQLSNKEYFSGKAKQIGDTILFGMLKEESEDGELGLKLITFHEEEIGTLYEEDIMFYRPNKINKLPNIKKIDNGGN
jgi:hypothetical protein